MAKNRVRYNLMSYNRYTESFTLMQSFKSLKGAKQWMWNEILDWLHMGFCVQNRTEMSVRMKDSLGNIAAYKIVKIAA